MTSQLYFSSDLRLHIAFLVANKSCLSANVFLACESKNSCSDLFVRDYNRVPQPMLGFPDDRLVVLYPCFYPDRNFTLHLSKTARSLERQKRRKGAVKANIPQIANMFCPV